MSSMEEQFAQFQAFLAMQASEAPDATTAKVMADAPKSATQAKRANVAAKAAAVAKPANDTALLLVNGKLKDHPAGMTYPNDSVAFRIAPTSMAGARTSAGARVYPLVSGHAAKSLTREVIAELQNDGVMDAISNAIETVDKRAMIGAYRPVVSESNATEPVAV